MLNDQPSARSISASTLESNLPTGRILCPEVFACRRGDFYKRVFCGVVAARGGKVATVVDNPVGKVRPLFFWQEPHQVALYAHRVEVIGEVKTLYKADNVRVDSDTRYNTVRFRKYHGGGFSRDAWKF